MIITVLDYSLISTNIFSFLESKISVKTLIKKFSKKMSECSTVNRSTNMKACIFRLLVQLSKET